MSGGPVRTGTVRGACLVVAFAVALACNPSTTRPPFAPFLDADVDTLLVEPVAAVERIANRLREDGYSLTTFSVIDRFVETAPRNLDDVPDRQRRVVIRIWADPAAGRRSRITSEVVFERVADPSRTRRDREELVRYDHPARRYLRQALRDLRGRAGA